MSEGSRSSLCSSFVRSLIVPTGGVQALRRCQLRDPGPGAMPCGRERGRQVDPGEDHVRPRRARTPASSASTGSRSGSATRGGPQLGMVADVPGSQGVPRPGRRRERLRGSSIRGGARTVDWRAMQAEAKGHPRRARRRRRPGNPGPRASVSPTGELLEIAKALSTEARLLIMDEPTAALSAYEVAHLFLLVRKLRDRGVADRLHLPPDGGGLWVLRYGHRVARRPAYRTRAAASASRTRSSG